MKKDISKDTNYYIIGWSCILFILIYVILKIFLKIDLIDYASGCVFNKYTGLYCPGCGGTRSIFALIRGDILRSVRLHPVVPYGVILGGWFMISQTIQRITRGEIKIAMHFRMIYVWIALALVLINFLWKNGVLLFTGVALL